MIDDKDTAEAADLNDELLASDEPADVKEALRRELRSRGVVQAYRAMIDVCRNPSAPAPARATCAATIFRAAGYLGKAADDDSDSTPIEQMTQEQMVRALAKAEADKRAYERRVTKAPRGRNSRDSDGGVFD